MRKFILSLVIAAAAMTANAQERGFYGNKFTDNWYVGAGYSLGSLTRHNKVFKNANSGIDVRVGKYFSPIFGIGVEGNYFFTNKPMESYANSAFGNKITKSRYFQFGIFASANLMNIIGGYYGEPRFFEVQPMTGFYWGINTAKWTDADAGNPGDPIGTLSNTLVHKIGVDLFFNLGRKKMFQIYVEPSFNYVIAGVQGSQTDEMGSGNQIVLYHASNSYLGLNIGLNYKFLTSNGSHNFMVVEACDQSEMDELNNSVNALRQKSSSDEDKLAEALAENERLQKALKECEDKPAVIKEVSDMPDLPAVFYELNKSAITPAQQMNVAIAAEVMKNHKEYKLDIKGYASPEGPHDNNTDLGIRRANAVKDMLMKKYKISGDRITTQGCGETDKLYPIFELNRVAVMKLSK